MEYSSWLGHISDAQIQYALDRFQLGTLLSAEPTGIGLGNQTLFLTSTVGEYVFRGKSLFPGQLQRERFFSGLIHQQSSVAAPWPYHYDPTTDIFGWEYAIMPRLPGLRSADIEPVQSPTDRRAIVTALARGLARLHEVRWPSCGEYEPDADTIKPIEAPYAAWMTQRIRDALQCASRDGGGITSMDEDWVEGLLAAAAPALHEPFRPTFVMHDYHRRNVLFSHNCEDWEVCGVFDLSEGYIGDGEADLSRASRGFLLVDPPMARLFVQEYLHHRPARPGFAQRFAVYMLEDLLIGWAYGRRMGWRDSALSLRELSEPFTSAAQSLLS